MMGEHIMLNTFFLQFANWVLVDFVYLINVLEKTLSYVANS